MSASRAKGTKAESAVVSYLQANGFPHAERRALNGNTDKGDVAGIPGVVVEVKNCRRDELPGWVDEANREAANAHAPIGVVVHKRAGKGDPARWFVTLDLATFARLIADDQPGGAA